MRKCLLALVAAILFAMPVSAVAQPSIQIGPGGVRIDDGRGRGPDCNSLRLACERKDQLGERGEGNCRRYRELCAPRPSRAEVCRDLREACLRKDELGERGEGNCGRYRQTCRGY